MKRFLALFLALAMIMAFTACGGQKENVDTDEGQPEGEAKYRLGIILAQGGLGDLGYNDDAKIGADNCAVRLSSREACLCGLS